MNERQLKLANALLAIIDIAPLTVKQCLEVLDWLKTSLEEANNL